MMKKKSSVSVVMPVHNQEKLISSVMWGLLKSISEDVKEIIVVLDGCTDMTERVVKSFADITVLYTPDVFETIACNHGFRAASGDYILTLQDDMVLQEPEIDRRLRKPFAVVPDLLGVTARNAQNDYLGVDGRIHIGEVFGRDASSPRGTLGIRDVIVRGPILFDHANLRSLGYLDETFAPLSWDDHDLSYRAYRRGMLVGAYVCDYESRREWGSTRAKPSGRAAFRLANERNEKEIIRRHRDLLTGKKHTENINLV